MQSRNPATEEIIAEYAEHSPVQIERTLETAASAFARWRRVDIQERCILLKRVAADFRRQRGDLAKLMTSEVGKTITASEAEIDKCAGACEFFAERAEGFLAPRMIESDASRSYVRFDPLGPVLAIMPWNFPMWQVIRFAAPALMAGNVALLKHAPNVPGCALALERLFAEAGFPLGIFSAILISDNQAAQKLVDHPVIRAVTLTGSDRAGAAVAGAAGAKLKKTVMELGGSDAFIVLADADIPTAAIAAAEARCINNGQSCIAAKRFIVDSKIAKPFEKAMIAAMASMKLGDPMDRSTKIGPLARRDLLEHLDQQIRQSIEQGATLKLGGRRVSGKGYFYEPTVLTDLQHGMAAMDEETFGPVAGIIVANDPQDAIRLANESSYGLGASIWTTDASLAQSLAADIEAGSVFINGIVKSDSRLPFGGVKNSGWGRELSQFGIHEFTNIKAIWMK